jgi:hypothetical protein
MTDELTRLKAHRADVQPPTADCWRNARSALTDAIDLAVAQKSATHRDSHRLAVWRVSRPRRWMLRAGIAVAVAIAAVVLTAVLRPGSPASPQPASAKRLIAQLEAVAASQPPDPLTHNVGPGSYRYVHTQSTDADVFGKCTLLVQKHRETWIARDRSGLQLDTAVNPIPASSADRAACAPVLASPSVQKTFGMSEELFGRGCGPSYHPLDPRKLPSDPAASVRKLETVSLQYGTPFGGPPASGPGAAFTQIGDLLRNTGASPALRTALYRLVALLPGVRSLGQTTDSAGRQGVALALVDHGLRHTLIFDPKTAALLGELESIANSHSGFLGPVGTVIEDEAYWPITIVHSLPHLPVSGEPKLPTYRFERMRHRRKDGAGAACERKPVG